MRIYLLLGVITWYATSSNVMAVDRTHSRALEMVTESINIFAKDFFQAVAKKESGNVICSPLSASIALSMLACGARGNTKKMLYSALDLNENKVSIVNSGMQSLIDYLHNFNDRIELRSASKVFFTDSFHPKDEFTEITEGIFRSKCEAVSFANSVRASRTINKWCQAKTNDHIKSIVQPGDFDSSTAIVLVNVMYFNGGWKNDFHQSYTKKRPFYVGSRMFKHVPTMNRRGSYGYGQLTGVNAKFVQLPYKSNEKGISMFIILPNRKNGLTEVMRNFHRISIDELFNGDESQIDLYLPKFKAESTINLHQPLNVLGLKTLYTDSANFTGIVDDPPIKIGKAIQKALIVVNEKGTEASAATGSIGAEKGSQPKTFVNMKVDHPFLYLIITHSPRAILFQGIVRDFDS